ncbi:FUSC family protein [Cetobacterium sp. 8H]|uniref:FUSC family protein n=1 Tax=Cetobacterium sp. 8H TaxID=2759681 RepID=UPI00163C1118|nr:FUSC family protein [Cetobacterium sp. 8H]MBC2851882.1 FUSC family protein [Cetobacterium sp. 8H]
MSEFLEKSIITISSILITTILGNLFKVNNLGLFYVAITCVIITNVDFDQLIESAKSRGIGTIVGGIIGVIFAYIPIAILIKLIIGEIIILYFCEKKLKIPSAIASVVFLIIIYKITPEAPYLYGLKRIIDTFSGIIITVIVTYLVKAFNSSW